MNIPIVQWPVVLLSGSSLRAMEHTTSSSFSLHSSIDHSASFAPNNSLQDEQFQPSEDATRCDDTIYGNAGPYDDDGEVEPREDGAYEDMEEP